MKTCIFVLGMHRSGTSALTRTLNLLGAELGPELKQADAIDNPTGYWEAERVVELNDQLFAHFDSHYMEYLPLPGDFQDQRPVQLMAEQALKYLVNTFSGASLPALKDPRLSRTFPVWRHAAERLGWRAVAALSVRDPRQVADSLMRRDRSYAVEDALLLWLAYMLDAERYSRGLPRATISYDDLLADPAAVVSTLATTWDLGFPQSWADVEADVRGFLQLELRRSQPVDTGADPLSIAALADETAAALFRRPLPDAAIFDALYTRFRMLTDATEAVRRRDRQANLRLKADNVELAAISEKRRHEQQEITRIADERLNQVRALGIGIEEREQRIGELGRTIRYLETLVGS